MSCSGAGVHFGAVAVLRVQLVAEPRDVLSAITPQQRTSGRAVPSGTVSLRL
jgi:hypothetical protein